MHQQALRENLLCSAENTMRDSLAIVPTPLPHGMDVRENSHLLYVLDAMYVRYIPLQKHTQSKYVADHDRAQTM